MIKKLIATIVATLLITFLGASAAFPKIESATFAWDQVIPADFAGWTLYMSTTQGGPYNEFVQIPYDPGATEYESIQVINSPDGVEATYYFVMTARDTNSNESSYSNEVSLTVDAISPGAPQSLTVTIVVVP